MKKLLTALLVLCTGAGGVFGLFASSNEPVKLPEDWGDVLVVYYSATGSTEKIAGYIADAAGGDVFELVPAEALVSSVPENWESYDTVFIGYPIWWGIAAWPVNGFVAANDFTGKNIVPFCTSLSSGLGDSGSLLAEMAGEGSWFAGHRTCWIGSPS